LEARDVASYQSAAADALRAVQIRRDTVSRCEGREVATTESE